MKFKKNKKDEVVVIGIGKLGSEIIKNISKLNRYYIIAIDEKEENLEEISEFANATIVGNAAEEEFLNEVGIANAQYFIVAIGDNIQSSLLISSVLKDKFDGKVIVRSEDKIHRNILKKLGISTIINPNVDSANQIAFELSNKEIDSTLNEFEIRGINESISYSRIKVPKQFYGLEVKDLELPPNILIMMHESDETGKSKIVNAQTKLEENESIYLIGENKNLIKFLETVDK